MLQCKTTLLGKMLIINISFHNFFLKFIFQEKNLHVEIGIKFECHKTLVGVYWVY